MAQRLKRLPKMQETQVRSLGWEDPLEKEMVTHSSILAWRIPWTEEPGRLQSMGRKESDMTERLHFHFTFTVYLEHPATQHPQLLRPAGGTNDVYGIVRERHLCVRPFRVLGRELQISWLGSLPSWTVHFSSGRSVNSKLGFSPMK